jgi:transposase-like protein
MSLSDIKLQIEELYGADISESLISRITDDVIEDVKAWQTRPLESVYPIVFFDCLFVKVRHDKRIINKAVYVALGIDITGRKDILGLWISENEGLEILGLVILLNLRIEDYLIY